MNREIRSRWTDEVLWSALIYAASRPDQKVPNFYASNDEALADLRRGAEADPLPAKS